MTKNTKTQTQLEIVKISIHQLFYDSTPGYFICYCCSCFPV